MTYENVCGAIKKKVVNRSVYYTELHNEKVNEQKNVNYEYNFGLGQPVGINFNLKAT